MCHPNNCEQFIPVNKVSIQVTKILRIILLKQLKFYITAANILKNTKSIGFEHFLLFVKPINSKSRSGHICLFFVDFEISRPAMLIDFVFNIFRTCVL